MSPRSILVTGAAGFIGSNLVRKLLAGGHRVMSLDSLTYAGNLESLAEVMEHPRHCFVEAHVADEKTMNSVVRRFSPDCIFHLAAETHVDRSIKGPMEFLRTNVLGTGSLLQASLEYWNSLEEIRKNEFRFIHISTDEVFGSLEEAGSFSETSPYEPRSPYSASKASSDHLVRAWGITYGLPVIVTNCSNNYGSYQFPEKLIPLVISNVLRGQPVPIYGKGLQIRDWIHVEDHCEALLLIAEKGKTGETYVIGGKNEWRNIDLVELICVILREFAEVQPTVEFVADRAGHDFRYSIDTTKIRTELGWVPRWDFNEGLRATVKWYLENRLWWERLIDL